MWLKCQDGSLVNLDNIVHVEKQYRYGQEEGKAYRVVAIGGRDEDDFYPLASKLTEEEAQKLIATIFQEVALAR